VLQQQHNPIWVSPEEERNLNSFRSQTTQRRHYSTFRNSLYFLKLGMCLEQKSFIVPSFGSAIRREDGTIDFFFAYLSEESSEGFADNAACIPFDQLSNT